MKYKVGDKVLVRDDLVVGKEYGSWYFIKEMKRFRGKVVTIKWVCSTVYGVEENRSSWTDKMFSGRPKNPLKTQSHE